MSQHHHHKHSTTAPRTIVRIFLLIYHNLSYNRPNNPLNLPHNIEDSTTKPKRNDSEQVFSVATHNHRHSTTTSGTIVLIFLLIYHTTSNIQSTKYERSGSEQHGQVE